MAGLKYTINCIFVGEKDYFPVNVKGNATIGELKAEIENKVSNSLAHMGPNELTVWKLNDPVPVGETQEELLKHGEDVSIFCIEMNSLMQIGDYFKESPPSKHIHAIVQAPCSVLPTNIPNRPDALPFIRSGTPPTSIASSRTDSYMDDLLEKLKATQPTNNCYSKLIRDTYEALVIANIEKVAYESKSIPVHSGNAGTLLFLIWDQASILSAVSKIRPPTFGTSDHCDSFICYNPRIISLLDEVCKKKAYFWLCENLKDIDGPTRMHIDRLIKRLKATQPTNSCYSERIDPDLEEFLITKIEKAAYGNKSIPVHHQNAGRLLFLIWEEASKFSTISIIRPPMFGTLDQCNAYVSHNPNILVLLAEVCKKKAYLWLCENLKDVSWGPGETRSPALTLNQALFVLEELKKDLMPALKEYLQTRPQLPLWRPFSGSDETRAHIISLRIPKLSPESSSPSFLLHNLGQATHDPNLVKRIEVLFHRISKTRFLCNVSGSGKTRLLFEGLWRSWGFYFTATTSPDTIGSSDIEAILEALAHQKRPIEPTDSNRTLTITEIQELTSRRFILVLYVRMLVFRLFLECALKEDGGLTEDHKGRWLLLQVAPKVLFGTGTDIFSDCAERMKGLPEPTIKTFVREELNQVQKYLPQGAALFCVLDNAQVVMNRFQDCFQSKSKEESLSIFRQITLEWSRVCPNLIISGTGLSIEKLEIIAWSSVAKESSEISRTYTDLGSFDDEEAQRAYLEQYLPPGSLNNDHWKAVILRAGYWLHGRYQFTASYLSKLIQNNFESPHRILNDFVYEMSDFFPSDFDPTNEPLLTRKLSTVSRLDFSKLNKDEALHGQFAGFVFDYVFHGQLTDIGGGEYDKMVEYGVARFGSWTYILADEPLALLAAMKYFITDNSWTLQHFLKEGVSNSNQYGRGTAFKYFGAYVLGMAFKSARPLSEVFTFVGNHSSYLQNEEGKLVAVEKTSGEFSCYPVDISSNTRPMYRHGYTPRTQAETLSWLQNPKRTTFCFPAHTVGPDLILVLQLSDRTVIRVVVQFKQVMRFEMIDGDVESLFRTTDPGQFLSKRPGPVAFGNSRASKNVMEETAPLQMKDSLQEALRSLGPGTTKAGEYGVLRVLIAHPRSMGLASLAKSVNSDESHHPAAIVDMTSLATCISEKEALSPLLWRLQEAAIERKKKPETDSNEDSLGLHPTVIGQKRKVEVNSEVHVDSPSGKRKFTNWEPLNELSPNGKPRPGPDSTATST